MATLLLLVPFHESNPQEKMNYPSTKKIARVDNYFGTEVPDPYRWLENTDSPETKEWIEAENKVTFDYLRRIPFRDKIRKRLIEIWDYPKYSAPFKAGDYYFYYKNDGLQNQSVLYIQKGLEGEPSVFLDPNKFSDDGTIALVGTEVSNNEKYLSYSVSKSGSDWQEIYVKEISTGRLLDDHVKWAKFAGAFWFRDGFFYGRYDEPVNGNKYTEKNEYQKVYYHKIGTQQTEDSLYYEDTEHANRQQFIWSSEDERFLFLWVGETGMRGNSLYYKNSSDETGKFIPLVEDMEHAFWTVECVGCTLYMFTNRDAPNSKVISVDLDDPEAPWKDVIAEKDIPLTGASIVGGRLITTYMKDVIERVYVHDLSGKFLYEVEMPGAGSVSGFSGKKKDKTVFYVYSSMVYPPTIFRYDIDNNKSTVFRKSEVKFNPEDYESKQVFYTSKDGTRIPMFIVHKRGLIMNGNNPTFLNAYGGFKISEQPSFGISRIVLLENGGVLAVPNLRGGGEYGEKWHEAGMKEKKQNVFDDFIAAAEYLINERYTSPEKLAISGGSNGGLLIGAVENQRPDLFKVCFPAVGVMDMLRFHKFTIGNSWTTEYGSSDNEDGFKYLYAYSPLHNIKEGIQYPATLVTTADHDDRVVPSHSFKYIATLQEKYEGSNPVLIRIETKAGHGNGTPTSKIIEENTDMWSFMFYNMGITPIY
jgi:prolyl oligopeptidase